jgi:ABC-type branched-subunit amino acid transport system ATPase component
VPGARVRPVVVDGRDLVLAHEDHIAISTSSLQLSAGSIVAIIGPNVSG